MPKSKLNELFLTNPKAHRLVGRRIKYRRASLLLGVSTVAKQIGISPDSLQQFELGKTKLSDTQMDKLQDVLRLSSLELAQGIASAA